MKNLTKYFFILAAMGLAFSFASCKLEFHGDVTYYTVTFDSKGGSDVKSQEIESGKKATKPTDPTKDETETEAFIFDGWYTSSDGGITLSDTAFNFDTAIEKDITLYAKWKEDSKYYIELKDCSVIHSMFESLCEYDSASSKFNKTITRFAKADLKPESAEYYLDAKGNQIPLWYDEEAKTLYYYLEPGKKMSLRTSDGTNSLFKNMTDAISIETCDFDTSNVTCMERMFSRCSSITALDVSNFDTSNVTDMFVMFSSCSSLTALDLSSFDTSNVTDMIGMFSGCTSLTALDLSNFDTSNVTDMHGMFESCSSLTALDLSSFDTSNVTDMHGMFESCSSLTALDLNNFDTSKVINMGFMFEFCTSLTALDLSNFDTSKVTDMGWIFYYCTSLTALDLSSFDTNKVTDMSWMFYNCKALKKITVSEYFVTDNVTDSGSMFASCTSLKGGAGTEYNASHIDKEYARIDGGTKSPGYFTKKL